MYRMHRRRYLAVLGVGLGLAGCADTENTSDGSNGGWTPKETDDSADQDSRWKTEYDTQVIGDTQLPLDLESGDRVRIKVTNERGYATWTQFYAANNATTFAEGFVETEQTFEAETNKTGTHYVILDADERATVVVEVRKSG